MNKKYIDFVPSSRARGVGSRVVTPRRKVVREIREEDVVVALPNAEQVSRTRVVRAVSKDTGVVRGVGRVRSTSGARGVDEVGGIDGTAKKGTDRKGLVTNHREDDTWREAAARYREDDAFSIKPAPKLGVVEDYKPRFVNTDVPKRPLHNESAGYTTMAEAAGVALANQGKKEIAQAKTQKVKRGLLGRKKREIVPTDNKMSMAQRNAEKDTKAFSATRGGAKNGLSTAGEVTSDIGRGADARRGVDAGKATSNVRVMNTGKVMSAARGTNAGKAISARKGMGAKEAWASLGKERDKKALSSATFVTPRSPFINQDKVVKRPLSSRNVYQKPVVKEEKKGPVTIITNSEKDSKVGLLVTIILTIVLGAAAGTVAFLLLPK